MLRIGLNTNVYIDHSIDRVIRMAHIMGYDGIEIARTHLLEYSESDISTVKSLITKYGLTIYGVQGGNPYTNMDFGKKRIELARKLDCPIVNLGPGVPYKRGESFEKALEITLEALRELRDYAGAHGIEVAVEPEIRALLSPYIPAIDRYQLYEEVRTRLQDIGLVLDVEHALAVYENPYFIIRKYRNSLKIIHVSDTIGHLHLHLVPGVGDIDFRALFAVLKEVNYRNFISVEIPPYFNNPDEAAFESVSYLHRVLLEME
ncbi:MAG: sugar phosphate isomerase/epimerase family protein [Sulfolobales archaeon]